MRRRSSLLAAGTCCLLIGLAACAGHDARTPTAPQSEATTPTPGALTQLGLSSAFDSYVFLPFITDDGGPNDTPAQSDLNSFTRADNIAGKLGVAWTWDDINSWTGTGQTGDACALYDTDVPSNGFADYAVCVRITNTADGLQILQLPSGQSPLIYSCGDKKTDRCSTPNPTLPLGQTFCEVTKTPEAFPTQGDDGEDVLAACSIDLAAIGGATKANVLNVCSFPSGSPNSNAFDCVVTPGAGFLRIVKKTPTQSGLTFSFTLSPAATSGATSFTLTDTNAGDETSALIAVQPGNFSLSEVSIPTGWLLDKASCIKGDGTVTGTKANNTVSNIATTIGETTTCTFENKMGAPTLTVTKTVNPTQVPETGGATSYTVTVTNTSPLDVTLTTLSDDKFGNLNGKGDCATGGTISVGATYSCSFTAILAPATAGATHVNTVTATVTNGGGSATATANATVTYSDVAPTIEVTKTPVPASVPETGGSVTYNVVVTNNAAESVTLTTLTDDKFGDLNGQGTCVTGGTIAALGGTYSCSFSKTLSANAGTTHVNTITAKAKDNDNTETTDTGSATVTFTNVAPTVLVEKSANQTSVPETGGSVTYTVTVKNTAAEAVTLTALTDDVFGNLNNQGSCDTGGSIAPGATYSCTFTKTISGNAGTSHVNVVTGTVQDNDGSSTSDDDDATVSFSNVAPTVTVEKSASPTSVSETGGSVTYTVTVTNSAAEPVTLTVLTDDKFGNLNGQGTCATGGTIAAGATYSCSFSKTVSGNAGASHVNIVTATVRDNDNSDATDTDNATVTFTDVEPTITVTKTANSLTVPETGGSVTYTVQVTNNAAESVTLTALSDNRFGNLNSQGSCATGGSIAAGATYSCTFAKTIAGNATTTHVNTVTATAQDNDGSSATASDDATVTFSDVPPSVTVTKTANPTSVPETGGSVEYTVQVTNTSAESVTLTTLSDDIFGNLNNQGTCDAGGSIGAGASYTCKFSKSIAGNAGTSHVNTVTALVTDNDGSTANDTDDATVTFTNVAPTITVTKTANPTSVPETGGSVTFTVSVKNDAAESVTLTALSDNRFNILGAPTTCATGGTIAAGATYTCEFTRTISGNATTTHVNTVTATAQDNDGSSATDSDDATVTFTNVAPTITVTKTANPTSVPETGGSVTYTVAVTNNAAESVTLTALTDDKFGNLNGQGTCATAGSVAAGATYSCSFSKTVSGNAGSSHVNIVTATAEDNDGADATDTDDATVTFSNVPPTITVTKTANPISVPETGGSVTYTVSVKNDAAESVTLTSLSDNVFGNLNGQGSCATGGSIAVGGTYTCTFTKTIAGNAGTNHVNTVTAQAQDNDGSSATGSDDATVTFTDEKPSIRVTKTANPTSLGSGSGGGLGNFTPDRTYRSNGAPPSSTVPQFASPTCDDAGANDKPAQVDLNCFNRADNVTGKVNVKWSWDDINSWGGTGATGDGCALFDTDNDGNANVAVCARITNNAALTQVIQVPNAGAADVYLCNDTKPDRCAKQVTKLADIGSTTCTIASAPEAFVGQGDDGADVEATCSIDRSMQGLAGISSVDLLNVCSFPSGEPNSNPFDCVVSVGAGFIQIIKVANPTTTQLFGFTLSPASTDGTSKYAVQGGVTTGLIPATPGSNYSLTETLPAEWQLSTVTCSVDGQLTGTANVAQNKITGIQVKTGQTTVCTFTNSGMITGNVTYTIVVTNLGLEALTLTALTDDMFGGLNNVGTCATGGPIAASGSYTCTFTKTLTGAPGSSHTNTVTATARDNELNTATASGSATVSFLGSP